MLSGHNQRATTREVACVSDPELRHLGQPVKCLKLANSDWAPTLRLLLSAPQIFEMIGLDAERLVGRFSADIARIAAKIHLVISALE